MLTKGFGFAEAGQDDHERMLQNLTKYAHHLDSELPAPPPHRAPHESKPLQCRCRQGSFSRISKFRFVTQQSADAMRLTQFSDYALRVLMYVAE
ncbi:MAG: hypothetical protein WCA24_11170, partial [Thiomonas sp.]